MKRAAEKIFDILIASGMSESEAYALLVEFLEEDAELYVECVDMFTDMLKKKIDEEEVRH